MNQHKLLLVVQIIFFCFKSEIDSLSSFLCVSTNIIDNHFNLWQPILSDFKTDKKEYVKIHSQSEKKEKKRENRIGYKNRKNINY